MAFEKNEPTAGGCLGNINATVPDAYAGVERDLMERRGRAVRLSDAGSSEAEGSFAGGRTVFKISSVFH
jgi:hypothetical protein